MSTETRFRSRRPGGPQPRSGVRRRGDERAGACPESKLWGAPLAVGPSTTLEEAVLTTFAALTAGHPVECPVCSGPLTLEDGCKRCGAHLT
jgi:hypothetical protein